MKDDNTKTMNHEEIELNESEKCRKCGQAHNLVIDDAGAAREIDRTCEKCFRSKKLYFKFSDNCDNNNVIMSLSGAMAWIDGDELDKLPESDLEDYEYTLVPVMMTDEEFNALPHD